jgi:hypothetical protein
MIARGCGTAAQNGADAGHGGSLAVLARGSAVDEQTSSGAYWAAATGALRRYVPRASV